MAPDDTSAPDEVLAFWFGDGSGPRTEWFRKDPAFDAAIGARFGATIERALAGGLQDWGGTATGMLARIVVLDQFTRNVFRGAARAFAGDALALGLARGLVSSGADLTLTPLQRWFAYLPFEHAEDLAAQGESLRLFSALAAEAPSLGGALDYAKRHHDVILRFGRYPHRNALLGRSSSAEEEDYLRQPGSGF